MIIPSELLYEILLFNQSLIWDPARRNSELQQIDIRFFKFTSLIWLAVFQASDGAELWTLNTRITRGVEIMINVDSKLKEISNMFG